ncbi:MAG: type VI secretion system tip protein TssI/VgrG [Aquabacterium sp.]|jgi:type VI secretion system secreted protein VgrG|uniref:type VI secretion system Vgr family protein n=1 Tax=Aquabacterium sp. TaxID=1872578 RepID=UPI002A36E0DC|nr:type VI secretion system tip protein TssI/VgrG [Aquabacterium sp.]MDX9844166.1 type VI secretion system tip protein TssI/VgrG [Aquabacterium sp.]
MTDLAGIQSAVAGSGHSLIASVLDALGAQGLNQHTRLLRLHTPLGPDVLMAERATVTETLSPGRACLPAGAAPHNAPGLLTGFGIELLAVSTRSNLHAPDLLGQPVLLELLTAHSTTELRPFHGHVTRFELMGADGGLARYRLHIEPWTAFLAQRTDAWVFQDQSALDITEAIFADYQSQGRLMPQWRIDVADREAFAKRSLCTQFNETDLAFLQRLWAEEGLFTWLEHQGDAQDLRTLGAHTLVIADHNDAFRPNAQPRIRFTQAGAVLKEDSITRWHGHRQVTSSSVQTASWDYRAVTSHSASVDADDAHAQPMPLVHHDQPGAYAYETPAQAERRALIQQQSLQAERKRFEGAATVRTLQPGTTFTLLDHPEHGSGTSAGHDDDARFVVLGVVHRARNNLSADVQAGLQHLLGSVVRPGQQATTANASDEPLYEARLSAQRVSVPVRPRLHDAQGRLVHPRPTAWGTQTALVVGLDAPIHTDRDARIKLQFHWQRGAQASHRLSAPMDDNAPASDASGTWVRVAQSSWAGANWGGVFIPRLGQEVLVEFVDGDIDRPVIVGATYNGEGQPDAQGNRVNAGAAGATGNAPAWFPGSARQGAHEGHAHTATLSGFKSQRLDASQAGGGGYNQLVLDDTPGQGRALLHTTQSQTWLQIGHLLQQHDNQRLAHRGHGLELHTQAQGALRAAQGLHVSTHARAGGTSTAQGQPLNSREAQSQLGQHAELMTALHANAQTHLAKLPGETAADKLPAHTALQATLQSLRGTEQSGGMSAQAEDGASPDAARGMDGGHGQIPATERPDLLMSAAGDIAALTPAHTVLSTGQHTTFTAGQDTNLLAQRHQAWAVKDGISLFTRGEAKDKQRAVQEVGLKMHAASGNVRTEAQSDAFTLTAQKAIDLQSTAADIVITAPERIVLNGGGGYVKLECGNIEIGTSGKASFKAAMKELTGGGSASDRVELKKAGKLAECPTKTVDAAMGGSSAI